MKKYLVLLIVFGILSCEGKKEIQLPKADRTIIGDVKEHSPIYMFFKVEEKDTIADVNRKNSIVSTNWIFNIDKRLPLRLIVPELIKLQAKKDKSMHKNEAAENYFSYANDVKKTMAFLPFTKVKYIVGKPLNNDIYFGKNDFVKFNSQTLKKAELQDYLNNLMIEHESEILVSFDKKISFDEYIKCKVFLNSLKITKKGIIISDTEYLY
jgi:biopolymer transport protein ExbD